MRATVVNPSPEGELGATRAVVNRFREPGPFPVAERTAVRAFHRGLPGYFPTPLVRRTALGRSLGIGDLFVKYEGDRFGLQAFKALGGSWALHRLLATRPGAFDTVATASEGNHGRAVAWAARLMGLPCVIFLPNHAAPARIDNIRAEGARVILVEGSYEDAVQACHRESEEHRWQVVSDVGYEGYLDVPPLVVEGYSTLFGELDDQLAVVGVEPDIVLIPGGVGGILHAGVDHYRARSTPPRIVGVEPREADCLTSSLLSTTGGPTPAAGTGRTGMACLNCAEVSLPSWPSIRRGVDALVAIEDGYAEEAVRRLYQAVPSEVSLAAGTSGAAALGGLLALQWAPGCRAAGEHLALGTRSVAVVICTEGAIDRPTFDRVVAAPSFGPLPPSPAP